MLFLISVVYCVGLFLLLMFSELWWFGSVLLLIIVMFFVVICLLIWFVNVDEFLWLKLFLRLWLIVLCSSMFG